MLGTEAARIREAFGEDRHALALKCLAAAIAKPDPAEEKSSSRLGALLRRGARNGANGGANGHADGDPLSSRPR